MSKQLAKIEAITKKLKARYVIISRMHYFYIYSRITSEHGGRLQACIYISVWLLLVYWLLQYNPKWDIISGVNYPADCEASPEPVLASFVRRAPSLPLSRGWGRRCWRRTTPGRLPAWISISASSRTVVPEPAVATQTTMSAAETELHQRRQPLVPVPGTTERWLRPWASARCPRSPAAARCRPCPRWGLASSCSSSAAPASPLYHC
jgi:hypothetical protein